MAALDLVLRATQRRLTTVDRLRGALAQRPRHRWRRLLVEVLTDAANGVASPLERHYLRDVERRHRLPSGARNAREQAPGGWPLVPRRAVRQVADVVELDGREAHPVDGAFRDLRRDNHAVVAGETVLRFGWRNVVGNPCEVAAQVGAVLQARGWTGRPMPCGTGCSVSRTA